ncbi:MAG: ATP-binding protein, partial [Mycobacterium sp.]|nr:ATP-binding protein [Mycobacterium sp.]
MIYGREAELAELDRLLTDIRAGRGRLVLISGPAGVGKTHLAAAATAAAGRQGLTVAQSYAVEDPGAPVLWPWLRLLRDWTDLDALPALEADEPDATARFRLLDAISDAVIARTGPAGLLLVLEDMHWADRTSVLLLRHLHAASATQRLGVLVTCRDGTP